MKRLVLGTRGSPLATWQAEWVRKALLSRHAGLEVRLEVIRTAGDAMLAAPSPGATPKGLFTKEIEVALLSGRIDLAVHSLKDLPTALPEGLALAAVPVREDPADVLVSAAGCRLDELPRGATVMTGSPRRRAQLLHRRRDLQVVPIHGNIQTRLRKLGESGAQAMVLAGAGLVRLGLADRIAERLDPAQMLPACGQGALAVESRSDANEVLELLMPLDDGPARLAVTAERSFLAALGGGCRAPIGAHARTAPQPGNLAATGMVADLDGVRLVRRTIAGPCGSTAEAESLGVRLAETIRDAGAREILEELTGLPSEGAP